MRKRDRSRPILNSSNLGTSHLLPTLHFPTLTSSSFVLQTHLPSPPHRFRPLQWAALNNRVAVASFLLDNGADVSLGDGDKQTALHWACVRGSLPCAELLLRHGAKCKTTDVRGYDAAHVAAQYGHTGMLYHFKTRWDADLDLVDLDGRSPLHWAAYKGFPDAVKLLLFCDCDALRQDKEGCTALHWAAIRGKSEAAHVLGQSGGLPMLEALDSEGSTAARLATDKGHKSLGHFLATTQVGISHAPRSASAIAHTRTRRDGYLCPYSYHKGLLPLTVYSNQSLMHMVRETDTFLFIVRGPFARGQKKINRVRVRGQRHGHRVSRFSVRSGVHVHARRGARGRHAQHGRARRGVGVAGGAYIRVRLVLDVQGDHRGPGVRGRQGRGGGA
jgi:ankyrin repeat protein